MYKRGRDKAIAEHNIQGAWRGAGLFPLTFKCWSAITPQSLAHLRTLLNIANNSMDRVGHPLHLHGHKFWVLGSGSGTLPYERVADAPQSMINLKNPPYRDTDSGL
ncbi:hypothetical protein V1519DRAFT_446745 [Lipomyces tetrasporus]